MRSRAVISHSLCNARLRYAGIPLVHGRTVEFQPHPAHTARVEDLETVPPDVGVKIRSQDCFGMLPGETFEAMPQLLRQASAPGAVPIHPLRLLEDRQLAVSRDGWKRIAEPSRCPDVEREQPSRVEGLPLRAVGYHLVERIHRRRAKNTYLVVPGRLVVRRHDDRGQRLGHVRLLRYEPAKLAVSTS